MATSDFPLEDKISDKVGTGAKKTVEDAQGDVRENEDTSKAKRESVEPKAITKRDKKLEKLHQLKARRVSYSYKYCSYF